MKSAFTLSSWAFAAVIAAACGVGPLAKGADIQLSGGIAASNQSVDTTASKLVDASDAPAASAAPAAQPAAVRSKTLNADDPAKPDPTADDEARFEQEKAAKALTKVQVVRGSLFAAGEAPENVNGDEHTRVAPVMSYTSVTPMEPKKFRKHDIITVVVQEESSTSTTAKTDSQKQQDFDLALQQFLKLSLSNLSVSSSASPSNLPEVKFNYNNNRQNAADQERTDTATLRITATIVDVKPNGSLVIEATKQITMDKEVQHMTLSGVCRAADVGVDNTILSTQLADLKLEKDTTGEVRDGTKRGWLNSLIDKFNPF